MADDLVSRYPILAILGPRQCGKTTFAQDSFPEYDYLDLELPSDFQKIDADPELYLRSRKKKLIIDEAQRYPKLFPILRSLADRKRKTNGQYILLGSASFQLQKQLNESLSGRIAFLDLNPFNIAELEGESSLDAHWLKGGFPDALLSGPDDQLKFDWFEFYTRTLIERDLPSLGIEIDPIHFRRLWTMISHFHANVLNKNKIASSMGISPHTVERYLNILIQTFTVRLLPPYHANLKKRLIKSPKLYFRDSGLFHYFANILNSEELITSPRRGDSFEGYLVEQIIQTLTYGWEAFFFRTSDDIEVDLLLCRGKKIVPIEIKSKLSIDKADLKNLTKTIDLLGQKKGFVLSLGDQSFPASEQINCIGAKDWLKRSCPKFWESV